jgi:hypothetical protein
MIDWDWGKDFQHLTFSEYSEKLNGENPIKNNGWQMVHDFYNPFGVTQFTSEKKCCKCGAIGEGAINLGQEVKDKKKNY